jgi:hypothetical protein
VKKLLIFAGIVLMAIGNFSIASAEWNHGIGTGITVMRARGDLGFNFKLAGMGPVEFDVILTSEDFNDLTRSATGFGGYATDKTWLIQYSFLNLELEGSTIEPSGVVPVYTAIDFNITGAEVTVGRPMIKNPSFVLSAYGGARYTRHELKTEVRVGASELHGTVDNKWTDALIGVTTTVPIAETWRWNTSLDVGFGGSDGSYTAKTGVTIPFYKSWSATLFGRYNIVNFENGDFGDSDWYHYDVDEQSLGFTILYNW